MRTPALILTVMAATLLMAPASPQARVNLSRKDQAEESAKKVKELQKERIATLKQMADQTTKLFQHGSVSFEELCEARLLVLKAELDAAEKESDRITLYKNIVDVLKGYEKFAEERLRTAGGTEAPILKAKARRLEAEIHLEQAKVKVPDLGHHKIVVTSPKAKCEPTTDRSGGNGVSPTPHHYAERLWAPTAAAPPGVGYSFNN